MKFYRILFVLAFICCSWPTIAQPFVFTIPSEKGEKWWGGFTGLGSQMPFASNIKLQDMSKINYNNQSAPLLLSSKGRYVWGEMPFAFVMKGDTLIITSRYEQLEAKKVGNTLRDAYLFASKSHFAPSGKIPEALFFSIPQYNTWIELMYDQNEVDILKYAQKVKDNNFPPGVFMIDDNWQKYYGNFDFKPDRFPNPRAMTEQLHRDGFRVMVWICPYVTADSPEFRVLQAKGYLLKNKGSKTPAIIHWWNGLSACYDLTNPQAMEYLKQQLRDAQAKYGIDGFKFDGADIGYMEEGKYDFYDPQATNLDYTMKWAELGLSFPYNEYRACWKMGGTELVQRLGDKAYSWEAVAALIPDMAAAGLLGHLYTCPDMIGGGSFSYFLNVKPDEFDQELIVRSAQVHALMPMMQFSVAPWRILDSKHLEACRQAAHLHQRMGDYILQCAQTASQTGDPIVQSMEYAFPNCGYEEVKDQYMLGSKYLVAPMVAKGSKRSVLLPKGTWKDEQGQVVKGPKKIEIEVPLERLPYFEKMK